MQQCKLSRCGHILYATLLWVNQGLIDPGLVSLLCLQIGRHSILSASMLSAFSKENMLVNTQVKVVVNMATRTNQVDLTGEVYTANSCQL